MIGLIEEKRPTEKGKKRKFEISCRETSILGIRALHICLIRPKKLKKRALSKGLAQLTARLKSSRITRLCFSENFPHKTWFQKDFVEINSRLLFETLMGEIAAALAQSGVQTGAFFAKYVSDREERALLSMCRHFRYVMLELENGGALICQNIRRRLGISVIENPTAKQLKEADAAIFFNPPARPIRLSPNCTAVGADANCLQTVQCEKQISAICLSLSDRIQKELPFGFPREALVSLALENGGIHPREMKITALRIKKEDIHLK